MINTIELIKYQNTASCSSDLMSSKETFLAVSCQFKKGNVYGLISDFGCGSWALSTCIGGRGDDCETGKIILDRKPICARQLENHSAFIPEKSIREIQPQVGNLSVRECIKEALKISQINYTEYEIQQIFHLSDERFERPLDNVSGEIWLASLAIQYSLNKDIFCFPWLNMVDVSLIERLYKLGIINILKSSSKIILIPTSQKKAIRHYCDHLLIFERGYINYK